MDLCYDLTYIVYLIFQVYKCNGFWDIQGTSILGYFLSKEPRRKIAFYNIKSFHNLKKIKFKTSNNKLDCAHLLQAHNQLSPLIESLKSISLMVLEIFKKNVIFLDIFQVKMSIIMHFRI